MTWVYDVLAFLGLLPQPLPVYVRMSTTRGTPFTA